MSHSKIFQKNRALGYVSNHIPLITRYIERRKENLIVTCTGRTFHTYGCSHFTLLSVSGTHEEDITCLSADKYHVYTACGNKIFAWRRGTEIKHKYEGHEHSVHLLLPFALHLISIDDESNLKIWDIKTEEIVSELQFSNKLFQVTTIMHPATYINKILLGSDQGQMQLWNIRTMKLIYTFRGWSSPITVIEQAPAKNVVAVGLVNGKIILHNLKVDETIFELIQDWGLVTSISFRSDENLIMATGTENGHVVLWNLDQHKIESQISYAHDGAVTGLKFLPNEPLLVTSSADNSLKLWIFDLADGAGRLLRIRAGHAEPPTFIRFYGNDGHNILSVSRDSTLRIFSTITETFNKSLGRASYNKKASKRKSNLLDDPLIMPPMLEFSAETTREKDWDNVAAYHLGRGVVTTWSYDKLKMGQHKLLPEKFKYKENVTATSLFITQCGNFVIIGYSSGNVEKFNMQSGMHRGSYGGEKGAHDGPVKGVFVECLNETVVTAGKDKIVKFWSFDPLKFLQPKSELKLEESIEFLRFHKDNSLIALALLDFSIVLVDIDMERVIRRFEGHTSLITDATFNPDSRWLVTASLDRTIRIWDIPSAQLIDIFKVPEACVSLNFSPTGEFLATAHTCSKGIYLWSNRTLYSHVSLKAINLENKIPLISLPGHAVEKVYGSQEDENIVDEETDEEYVSPDQLNSDLVTMSSLPNSRWLNLLNIDIIKQRNKPREALKVPESAPFFLPTVPSLQVQFDFSDIKSEDQNSQQLVHPDFHKLTAFGQLLQKSIESNNYEEVINKIKSMGPSMIDFEIQSLTLDHENTSPMLIQFMKLIKYMLKSKKDFELAQAYLSLFLKTHGTLITEDKDVTEFLGDFQKLQLKSWKTLREKLFYNLSIVQHLKKS